MEPDLEVEIYYLTEEEGGRKTPVLNGYRGQFHYDGQDWDAPQQFIDKEICFPGEIVKVYLRTLSPEFHVGKLRVGQEFETREGARTVGKGKITKILRPEFEFWNEQTFLNSLPTNIQPYSGKELQKFCKKIKSEFSKLGLFDKVEITKTDRPECLTLITCKQKQNAPDPRILADIIIDCWKNNFSILNNRYKVQLTTKHELENLAFNLDRFVLSFATWDFNYLTGQIIVVR